MEYALLLEITWPTIWPFSKTVFDSFVITARSAAHAEAIARSGMIPQIRARWGNKLDYLIISVIDIEKL